MLISQVSCFKVAFFYRSIILVEAIEIKKHQYPIVKPLLITTLEREQKDSMKAETLYQMLFILTVNTMIDIINLFYGLNLSKYHEY